MQSIRLNRNILLRARNFDKNDFPFAQSPPDLGKVTPWPIQPAVAGAYWKCLDQAIDDPAATDRMFATYQNQLTITVSSTNQIFDAPISIHEDFLGARLRLIRR